MGSRNSTLNNLLHPCFAQRLAWTDPAFQMRVFFEEELQGDSDGSPPDAGSRQRLVEALTSGCQVG